MNKHDINWYKMYGKAVEFFQKYGHLQVPQNYQTEDGCNLGIWIHNQKKNFNPLSERGKLLLQIGMICCNRKYRWDNAYKKAEEYFQEHGDLEIPISFVTSDGFRLGLWVYTQRKKCDPLSERGQLLLKIGMKFGNKYLKWDEVYEKAKEYFQEHGDLEIPINFVTSDGYNLGMWIHNQRVKCNPESEHGKLLLKIGMRFDNKCLTWEQMYVKAEEYYNKYHDLDVPFDFKTDDGYSLGLWICNQKKNCNPESERGKLLLKIGMKFGVSKKDATELDWLKGYKCALSYYEEHGDLFVPHRYVTLDGYKLGNWISTQRMSYKNGTLSYERIYLLNLIGMVWNIKKNMFDIVVLCDSYNIDVDINRIVLMGISSTQFRVKLSYLNDNKISIVDVSGRLHEIFSMSNMNMKLKYGVSLEDLIKKYNKVMSK